jgi:hypothetical protein
MYFGCFRALRAVVLLLFSECLEYFTLKPCQITVYILFSGLSSSSNLSSAAASVSNLNLMSTTNEVKGEKAEVRQQIPTKLSSKLSVSSGASMKEKSTKKISSVVGMNKVRVPVKQFLVIHHA